MNAAELAKLKDAIPQTVCLYGSPKTGKTYAAAKLAEVRPVFWLDTENGMQTVFTHLSQQALQNITVMRCLEDGVNDKGHTADFATALVSNRPVQVCKKHALAKCKECGTQNADTYDTYQLERFPPNAILVIDSMTQIRESMILKLLGARPLGTKLDFDDWENLRQQSLNFMLRIQRFPRGLVLITHEQDLENEAGISRLTPIAGSRNFAIQVSRYFGTVVYAAVVNKKFVLHVSPEEAAKYQAGSRALKSDVKTLDSLAELFR